MSETMSEREVYSFLPDFVYTTSWANGDDGAFEAVRMAKSDFDAITARLASLPSPGREEIEALRAFIEATIETFENYAALHLAKSPPDTEKASRNRSASDNLARALPIIEGLEREIAGLKREEAESEEQFKALNAKIASLAPHGSCACSYDKPDDVCGHHSPRVTELEAQLTAALAERDFGQAQLLGERKNIAGWIAARDANLKRAEAAEAELTSVLERGRVMGREEGFNEAREAAVDVICELKAEAGSNDWDAGKLGQEVFARLRTLTPKGDA